MAVTGTGWLYVGLIALSATTTTVLAGYAYRNRREPGAVGFALTMAVLTVWSGCYAAGLLVYDPAVRTFLRNVQWIGTSVYVWLLLFALEYTGHDDLATRGLIGAVGAPWVCSWALVWTAGLHDLWWSFSIESAHGLAVLQYSYAPGFWVHTAYSYVIILFASALLLRLVFASDYLYTDQSALLLLGIAAPLVGNVVHVVFLEPGVVIDVTPIAFAATGVAFGYALFRRRLFDLVPATRRLGRNAAIGQLETGVVIVDTDYRVVYCNDAAAPVLGCAPREALDQELRDLVDVTELDLDAPDALAEIERGDTVYEVRTSPITDRHDRTIGHTLVAHDVTARKRRERQLATQRDELQTVSALNSMIRGVVQALVTETERDGIERTVCDRIVDGDLYHTACIGDVPTWNGDAARWTVAGGHVDGRAETGADGGVDVPVVASERLERADADDAGQSSRTHVPSVPDRAGSWVVVPIRYDRTVYGALGLATERTSVSDRERSVLDELGEAVGHAINAVSTRQLLSADTVVELELASGGGSDSLAAATAAGNCELELAGIVPSGDHEPVAYLRADGDLDDVSRHFTETTGGDVRVVREHGDGGLIEWRPDGSDLVGLLVDSGVQVRDAEAIDGRATYRVDVASNRDARSLVDRLQRRYDRVRLVSKRERAGPLDDHSSVSGECVDDLTDRQRASLQAAYRAGYFEWPRDSTAEDVASALDIAPSTLHAHLRKAESSLFADLFDSETGGD